MEALEHQISIGQGTPTKPQSEHSSAVQLLGISSHHRFSLFTLTAAPINQVKRLDI